MQKIKKSMPFYHGLKHRINYLLLLLFCFLDLINIHFVKSAWFNTFIFTEIKHVLFSLDGQCLHTGYCCNHIQLKVHKKWIQTTSDFNNLRKKQSIFQRFRPVFSEQSHQHISYFSCSSLGTDNLCQDYDSRPSICRQYPYSVFLSHDVIREGCGYFIKQVFLLPFFASSSLRQRVHILLFNNQSKSA